MTYQRLNLGLRKMAPGTFGGQSRIATPVVRKRMQGLTVSIPESDIPETLSITFASSPIVINNGYGDTVITSRGAINFAKANATVGNYYIRFEPLFGEDRVVDGGFTHEGFGPTATYARWGAATEGGGVDGEDGLVHVYLAKENDASIIRWPQTNGYATTYAVELFEEGISYITDIAIPLTWGIGKGYATTYGAAGTAVYSWDRTLEVVSANQEPATPQVVLHDHSQPFWMVDIAADGSLWLGGMTVGSEDIATVWHYSPTGTLLEEIILSSETTGIPKGGAGPYEPFDETFSVCEIGDKVVVVLGNNWGNPDLSDYNQIFVIDPLDYSLTNITANCTIDDIPLSEWTANDETLSNSNMQSYSNRLLVCQIGRFSGNPRAIMGTVSWVDPA